MSHETQKWIEAAARDAITTQEIQPWTHQLMVVGEFASTERMANAASVSEIMEICRDYQERLTAIIARHAPSERNQVLEEAAAIADKAAADRRRFASGGSRTQQILACATQAEFIAADIRALQSRPPCTCTCTPCTDGNHVCCNFRCDAKNRTGENIERVAAESRPAASAEPSELERLRDHAAFTAMRDALQSSELMEKLAAIEHDRWAGQAKTAVYEMTFERRTRWMKFADTPYAELAEDIKELDRVQVREYLAVIGAALAQAESCNKKPLTNPDRVNL